jgi:hypothetical protein
MDMSDSMCENLAKALGGEGKTEKDVCKVTIHRSDINAVIGNKKFSSTDHMFDFGPADANGNALITGEMVLLENEVPGVVAGLTNAGIIVSAIHTHWLFDSPKLIYIHVESITNPMNFASRTAQVLRENTSH